MGQRSHSLPDNPLDELFWRHFVSLVTVFDVRHGHHFIDTADVYSAGVSEEIVGAPIASRRDSVFLATKFFMPMGDDPNHRGGSRRIVEEIENSLRRLGTDHIDLYQVHRPSPDIYVEETLGALTDLVRHGKVRYIGSMRSSHRASPSTPRTTVTEQRK